MNIISLVEQIKNDEIVLPAIQRDFVWPESKIEKLFDSIMRGYPIGILLLWETYNDIQYRSFVKDYRSDNLLTFHDNKGKKRLKLVLDGQQRLQSLYIALQGTHEGKPIYFDVISGLESEDFREDRFLFQFMTLKNVQEWNSKTISTAKNEDSENSKGNEKSFFVSMKELLSLGPKERKQLRNKITAELKLSEEDEMRLDLNLSIFRDVLTSEGNILKASVIDENKPSDSPERKSEADVLEAFVRINREGTPLSRSDLIFSMLKLNWKESATTLPQFVNEINKGNSFELDSDFVIRCLYVVSDLGSKFDIDILRKKGNVKKIQDNFDKCCNAIRSTLDFVNNECWISSSKLLGGYYNLVPFVYYLFHTSSHQIPNSQIERIRKSIYLFGFTSPFSRYADSRLGKFIRDELKPLAEKKEESFPFEEALYWVWYWEKISNFGPELVNGNVSLALHLVQGLSGAKTKYEKNAPQIDHIFPRSILRKKKVDEAEVNHFANFWILTKNKNQNKSNKHPDKYFEDVPDSVLRKACIERELLDYRRYRTFLTTRTDMLLTKIMKKLSLSSKDFNVKEHWEIDTK